MYKKSANHKCLKYFRKQYCSNILHNTIVQTLSSSGTGIKNLRIHKKNPNEGHSNSVFAHFLLVLKILFVTMDYINTFSVSVGITSGL